MKKVLLIVLLLCAASFAFADDAEMKPDGKVMDCPHPHGGMMAMHEKMMTDMKAMDTKLDELVATMNSASADKKVDAMSALLTEMVSQRKKMQQMMMMATHGGPKMMEGCCGGEGAPKAKEGAAMSCCMGEDKN